jgi:hypothetical protein
MWLEVQDAAPHHGTSHVMMAIARPSSPLPMPARPGAPAERAIPVDWSAPTGTVVTGSSIAWTMVPERVEDSVRPHRRSRRRRNGFAVRMRAFNDGSERLRGSGSDEADQAAGRALIIAAGQTRQWVGLRRSRRTIHSWAADMTTSVAPVAMARRREAEP